MGFKSVLKRNLIFVTGKGGVGKTSLSKAIALRLSQAGKRTLWVSIEDPLKPPGEIQPAGPNLWYLNCEAISSFEEYVSLKIGVSSLSRLFLKNKLVRYLAKASPGIHELVMLGKIWFERNHFDHVVVDMPSTGYTLALFQSVNNFSRLFRGGPIHRDADEMLVTFGDPTQTGILILALPEEMPLVEALELNQLLLKLFPNNPSAFIANRLFPTAFQGRSPSREESPEDWKTPLLSSAQDYVLKRGILENFNLRLWRDENIQFESLKFCDSKTSDELVLQLSEELSVELKKEGLQ